jgi:hypothetical protein
MTADALIEVGFSPAEAESLSSDKRLKHKNKTADELRVLFSKIAAVYGCDEATVKRAILKQHPFAGLDHERVVREATVVYGDEAAVKMAILSYPPFAGLDHKRVMHQCARLGRIAGLSREEVISNIFTNPVLAGYSTKRYLAGLDVGRKLAQEGFERDVMLDSYLHFVSNSPYVPGLKRKRISHGGPGCPEPPLLKAMRKQLKWQVHGIRSTL